MAIQIKISPQAQAMLDEADERWTSEHGFVAENPLFDEVARAGELLRDTRSLVFFTAGSSFDATFGGCCYVLAGTSTTATTSTAHSL